MMQHARPTCRCKGTVVKEGRVEGGRSRGGEGKVGGEEEAV